MFSRLPQISLAVVGADFPNRTGPSRRFGIATCARGDPVELRREPDNPYDHRAVAVFNAEGIQMGYLSAERCGRVSSLIEKGFPVRAIFQERTRYGCVIRAAFHGDEPVLPPLRDQGRPVAEDFFPDPEWPEE